MQVRTALSALAAGSLVIGTALPSQATTTPTVEVISSDVLAPFNLATRADSSTWPTASPSRSRR